MRKYTIDRFEEDFAVLLDRENEEQQCLVLKAQLPLDAREGDILQLSWDEQTNEVHKVEILKDETQSAKKKAEDLLQKLLNKNK